MAEYKITDLTIEQVKRHAPDLFKKIQEAIDPDVAMQELRDQAEAEKTTNQQLSQDNDNLRQELDQAKQEKEAEIQRLTKENEELKKENDTFKAEKAQAEKAQLVSNKLTEAKLPEYLVTEYFRESLMALDEEGIDKAIIERKSIAVGEGDKEITDDKRKKVLEAFGK